MPDCLTPEQRYKCMSSIHSRNTKPEVKLRKELFHLGYRYRINVKRLPGKPDIVLAKYRTCIFVNGCFWHGHQGCPKFTTPKTNAEFWRLKVENNRERDLRDYALLESLGWRVIVVWECELSKENLADSIRRIQEKLEINQDSWRSEIEDRKASRLQRIEENRQRKARQASIIKEMSALFGASTIRKRTKISKDRAGINSIEMIDEPELSSLDRKAQEETKSILPVLRMLEIPESSAIFQESPDFLVKCADGRDIGIEVTECHPSIIDNMGNVPKANNLKKHIIEQYKKTLKDRGAEHSVVCVSFSNALYGSLYGADKSIIQAAIEEIDRYQENEKILSNPERLIKGTNAFVKWGELLHSDRMNFRYIEKVSMTESDDFLTDVFENFNVRFTRDIALQHIQYCLDSKEKKLSTYKTLSQNRSIKEYWLVIDIPGCEAYDLDKSLNFNSLHTSYDKVFVNGFSETVQIK